MWRWTNHPRGRPNRHSSEVRSFVAFDNAYHPQHRQVQERPAVQEFGLEAHLYIDWDDVQIATNSEPFGVTTNGAQGRSEGLEFTGAVSPVSGTKLGCIAAYTEAGLTRVVPGPPLFLLAGYQIPNVPKWSLSVTADYDWQLSDRWQAHAGGVFRWIATQWGTAIAVASIDSSVGPAAYLPSYSVLDLNASIRNGALTLRAFARNVTDRRAWLQGYFEIGPPTAPGESGAAIIQPRTIGVGFDYSF